MLPLPHLITLGIQLCPREVSYRIGAPILALCTTRVEPGISLNSFWFFHQNWFLQKKMCLSRCWGRPPVPNRHTCRAQFRLASCSMDLMSAFWLLMNLHASLHERFCQSSHGSNSPVSDLTRLRPIILLSIMVWVVLSLELLNSLWRVVSRHQSKLRHTVNCQNFKRLAKGAELSNT